MSASPDSRLSSSRLEASALSWRSWPSASVRLASSPSASPSSARVRASSTLRSSRPSQERPTLALVEDELGEVDYVVEKVLAYREAGLALKDPTVSRYHCELLAGADHVTLRDLDSKNGTTVDDVSVGTARLEPGAKIEIRPGVQ